MNQETILKYILANTKLIDLLVKATREAAEGYDYDSLSCYITEDFLPALMRNGLAVVICEDANKELIDLWNSIGE